MKKPCPRMKKPCPLDLSEVPMNLPPIPSDRPGSASRFKGVAKNGKKGQARIGVPSEGGEVYLGTFDSEEEAGIMYARARYKYPVEERNYSSQTSLTTSPDQSETQRRIQITVRLGESIGMNIDTEGYVWNVTPGGQLEKIGGINVGDRIVEAGGTSLGTAELGTTMRMDQVISIIQEKTNRGEKSLDLTFEQVRARLLLSDACCL